MTDSNKQEYVRLVCQMKMTGAIRKQLAAFLEGFYDIIPRRLISIFNEQELELLLSLKDSFVLLGKGRNCENTHFCEMSHHLHPTGRDAPDGDFTFAFAWSLVVSKSPCLVFFLLSCSGKNGGMVALIPSPTDTPRRFVWGKDPVARAFENQLQRPRML